MGAYIFKARTPQGKIVKGHRCGELDAIICYLVSRNHYLLKIEPAGFPAGLKDRIARNSRKEITVFTRQLATLLNAGFSLLKSLRIMQEQSWSFRMDQTIAQVISDLEAGHQFYAALDRPGTVFSPVYRKLVQNGELGGVLEEILRDLADHLENELKRRTKLRIALVYPGLVLLFTLGVMVFLHRAVLPRLATIYHDLGAILPPVTRIMMWLGQMVANHIGAIFLLIMGLALAYYRLKTRPWFNQALEDTWGKIPYLGALRRKGAASSFSRNLALLLRAGIPLLEALEILKDTAGNGLLSRCIARTELDLRAGRGIGEALRGSGIFDPMSLHMVFVGEAGGNLEQMFFKVSDYYEQEIAVAQETLERVVEPVLILVISLLVGFMVLGTLWPLFNIMTLMG